MSPSKLQFVIELHCDLFIARPNPGLPPSNLPHGLHLPRREVEPRLGFTAAARLRSEGQAPHGADELALLSGGRGAEKEGYQVQFSALRSQILARPIGARMVEQACGERQHSVG